MPGLPVWLLEFGQLFEVGGGALPLVRRCGGCPEQALRGHANREEPQQPERVFGPVERGNDRAAAEGAFGSDGASIRDRLRAVGNQGRVLRRTETEFVESRGGETLAR